MQYQEKYQTFIFMILAIPISLIFFTISEHAPASMASHFASVQLWPLLRRDYDDVLAYCRGCVQAIELFTSQSMAYKYNY